MSFVTESPAASDGDETSLCGCWTGVRKLPAEVDGVSMLTANVGMGVRVAEIVASVDCMGPTTVDCVGPT